MGESDWELPVSRGPESGLKWIHIGEKGVRARAGWGGELIRSSKGPHRGREVWDPEQEGGGRGN